MSLKTIAAKVVGIAFDVAESLTLPAEFVQAKTCYEPDNGRVYGKGDATAITALFLAFSSSEKRNPAILEGDKKVLVQASDLSAVTPTTADFIRETASRAVWQIVGITLDTTKNLFTFHTRRAKDSPT